MPILKSRNLAILLRGETSRDTLYARVDVYTRRVLDSCFRIRERGEKEQTRGSPVPRASVSSVISAGRRDGRREVRRGALPPRSSSRSPFSLVASPASPFEFIRLPVRLISVFFHRTPTPPEIIFPSLFLFISLSLSLSLSFSPYCYFLHLIPPGLVVISTLRHDRENSPLDFRKICIRVSLIMREELARRPELSTSISRLLRGAE